MKSFIGLLFVEVSIVSIGCIYVVDDDAGGLNSGWVNFVENNPQS